MSFNSTKGHAPIVFYEAFTIFHTGMRSGRSHCGSGRANLRVELSALKRCLAGHDALEINRHFVRLTSRDLHVDVIDHLEALRQCHGQHDGSDQVKWQHLRRKLETVANRFLSPLALSTASQFHR